MPRLKTFSGIAHGHRANLLSLPSFSTFAATIMAGVAKALESLGKLGIAITLAGAAGQSALYNGMTKTETAAFLDLKLS